MGKLSLVKGAATLLMLPVVVAAAAVAAVVAVQLWGLVVKPMVTVSTLTQLCAVVLGLCL